MLNHTQTRKRFLQCIAAVTGAFAAGGARAFGAAGGACFWGISTTPPATSTATIETKVGRKFAGYRVNRPGPLNPMPGKEEQAQFDRGRRWIYRNTNWEGPKNSDGTHTPLLWSDVAAGVYDQWFLDSADALIADPRWSYQTPFNYSFHHEMSFDGRYQCGALRCGTPTDYIAAFQRVRSIFQAKNLLPFQGGKLRMVWCPHHTMFGANPPVKNGIVLSARAFDPGPDYYDLVGVDIYNSNVKGQLKYGTDASTVLGPAQAYAVAQGKQLVVPECGCGDKATAISHKLKATWINSLCQTIKSYGTSGPGSVLALCWTNETGWNLDSSTPALNALAQNGKDLFFTRTS